MAPDTHAWAPLRGPGCGPGPAGPIRTPAGSRPSASRSDITPAWNASPDPTVPPTMTTIGLIGSGHIGSTVARLAVDAGHDVVLSNSRGPETLQDLVDELGPRARAGTPEEAGVAGDLVVVTVPLAAVDQVPVEPLRGKVVIDTCNYYPQ